MSKKNLFHSNPNPNIPTLDPQVANQLLNNVLAVCDQAPHTVPVETLHAIPAVKTTSFRIGQIISIFVFIFLLLLPLCLLLRL